MKKAKRVCGVMGLVMSLLLSFMCLPVCAADVTNDLTERVVSQETYYDKNEGAYVTETIYVETQPFSGVMKLMAKSGSGTYKNEKTFTWTGGEQMKYYIKADFTWKKGKVTVKNATGGVSGVPSGVTIKVDENGSVS